MEAFSHDLVLTGDGRSFPDGVRAALAPRFSIAAGRSRAVRHTWLDTFDWLLDSAGLTLDHTTGTGTSQYVLTSADGEEINSAVGRIRWPALASALPAGPLRSRLEPVTGPRALLPVAQARGAVRQWRVLNNDEKTIAWLTVQDTSLPNSQTSLPPRLSVAAVRGYQPQADRVAEYLARVPGMEPSRLTLRDEVLAASGRRPGDYSGKVDVDLTAAMPARKAVMTVLLHLLGTLEANVAGTVRDIDTEFLHDLRVSVRRTRSMIKLCGDTLPAGMKEKFSPEFKWLGDVTTPVRDLDVYQLNYPSMTAGLQAATPEELAPFGGQLAARRSEERQRLVRNLRSAHFRDLTAQWRCALTQAPVPRGGPTVARLAAERIRRAHKRVLRDGAVITAESPPEHLHDLRKRCKELRYLLEFFASLSDPSTHRRAVKELKALQDCLGEYQDCQVQKDEIRTFAQQMMTEHKAPLPTLLAMGELAGQIAAREHRARAEFDGRFADFASAANRQRFAALIAAAHS